MFGCICTEGRVGGGFCFSVIESFTLLAEATAFVIGAAAELIRLGGGGLIQPEWAVWLMVLTGSIGIGVSSSLSANRSAPILV